MLRQLTLLFLLMAAHGGAPAGHAHGGAPAHAQAAHGGAPAGHAPAHAQAAHGGAPAGRHAHGVLMLSKLTALALLTQALALLLVMLRQLLLLVAALLLRQLLAAAALMLVALPLVMFRQLLATTLSAARLRQVELSLLAVELPIRHIRTGCPCRTGVRTRCCCP